MIVRLPAMSRTLFAAAILVSGLVAAPYGSARAEPRHYVIDPDHFVVAFMARHLGFADVLAQFLEGTGSFTFDEETRTLSNVRAEIKVASVFSDIEARDRHIRSEDFLWGDAHPLITFTGTGAEPTGDRTGKVFGELTVRGVGRPVVLDVIWNKSGAYPFGDRHYAIGISARAEVERSAFGMTYALEGDMVGDRVQIILELEAIRQDD